MLLLHANVAFLFSEGSRHFLFFSTQLQVLKHAKRDGDANLLQSTSLHRTASKIKRRIEQPLMWVCYSLADLSKNLFRVGFDLPAKGWE